MFSVHFDRFKPQRSVTVWKRFRGAQAACITALAAKAHEHASARAGQFGGLGDGTAGNVVVFGTYPWADGLFGIQITRN